MNLLNSMSGGERGLHIIPAIIMLGVAGILSLDPLGVASMGRNWAFDTMQSVHPRPAPDGEPRVHLIEIDAESLTRMGAWPWPRTRYAELAALADQAGAEAILLDDVMETSDPTSPTTIARHLENVDAWSLSGRGSLADYDALLGETLVNTKTVVPLKTGGASGAEEDAARLGANFVSQDTGAAAKLRPVSIERLPHDAIVSGASSIAFNALGAREGQKARTLPLVGRASDAALASDVLEAFRLATGSDKTALIQPGTDEEPAGLFSTDGLAGVAYGETRIPTTETGALRLWTRDASSLARIPAWQLFENESARAALSGSIAVISPTADPARGRVTVPGGARLTSGEVKAMALEQMRAGQFLVRPDWALFSEQIAFLLAGVAIIALMMMGMEIVACAAGIGAAVLFAAAGWFAFTSGSLLIDGLLPAFGLFAMVLSVSWQRFNAFVGRTRHVLSAVGGKLPTPALNTLARKRGRTVLSGQLRKITVMFCDIRDFDQFSELHRDQPEWMASLLNRFHDFVAETVKETGGVADTHQGTAVMGFWNAPVDDPDHARKACDCALKLIEGLDAFNRKIELEAEAHGRAFLPLHLAIGINTGHSLVGNLGSDRQVDYSALGDPVEIAHQLQNYSEIYGPAVIVGEHTQNAVKSRYALLEVDKIGLQGRPLAVKTYALLGNPVVRANPHFRALDEAQGAILEAYRAQNWGLARVRVRQARELRGAIPELYDFYDQRIDFFETRSPGYDWDGTFRPPVY